MKLTYKTLYTLLESYIKFQAAKKAGLEQNQEYQDQLERMVKETTRKLVDKGQLTLREQQHLSLDEGITTIINYEILNED